MASQNPNKSSLYPQVLESNPDSSSPFLSIHKTSSSSSSSMYPSLDPSNSAKNLKPPSSSASSMYPTIDMNDLAENLFPDASAPPDPVESVEEVLVQIPGAIVHLIDKQQSIELACGELMIVRLRQGQNVVAVLTRIGEEIQWPLAKDEACVKLDDSHYFFSLRVPDGKGGGNEAENLLNYGLTIASKGQEKKLKELDGVLEKYSSFSVQEVSSKSEVFDGAKGVSPNELKSEEKKEMMKDKSAAYWTTLAPNVEDYSGSVARVIAAGSGQLIRGILWGGDVTVDRLKWGNEFLRKKMAPCSEATVVSPEALNRIRRVKTLTKMTEKMATGVLSGVVRVSGFFTSPIVNSKAGKKFFSLLPGEIVLASLDGFSKVCDAVEVAGKNVMSTTSVVTTGLVNHKYGEKAAEATNEGFDAAGHAIGVAWAVFKIRKALNPKSAIKPTSLAKSAAKAHAAALKSKKSECGK